MTCETKRTRERIIYPCINHSSVNMQVKEYSEVLGNELHITLKQTLVLRLSFGCKKLVSIAVRKRIWCISALPMSMYNFNCKSNKKHSSTGLYHLYHTSLTWMVQVWEHGLATWVTRTILRQGGVYLRRWLSWHIRIHLKHFLAFDKNCNRKGQLNIVSRITYYDKVALTLHDSFDNVLYPHISGQVFLGAVPYSVLISPIASKTSCTSLVLVISSRAICIQ